MARPRASADGAKRDGRLCISLSRSEKSKLKEYAQICGLSVTEFIALKCVYDDQDFCIIDAELIDELRVELRRQGTNINQIAAALNSLKFSQKKIIKIEKANSALEKLARIEETNGKLSELLEDLAKRSYVRRSA